MERTRSQVIEQGEQDQVKFVSLQFTDVMGTIKNVTIPGSELQEALDNGIWFDGSSVEGFTRICESDMYLLPDPNTYQVLPWLPEGQRTARLICDILQQEGKPSPVDPRSVLRSAMAECAQMGYTYQVSSELEFFLFTMRDDRPSRAPVPHDFAGYFDFSPRDLASEVRQDIILALEAMGIKVERAHHEVASGQHEINFRYADALTSADNCMTFKYVVKAVAQDHGLHATFMPKPIYGINGSGMHTHQSLFDSEGRNAFFSPNDRYRLSPLAYNFAAGQMKHAKSLAAIVAPTVNSYKRLVPGYEAPVYICWGEVNRSALIRIPRYSNGRDERTRLELRCPDPSCNPYLAYAAMLKTGLEGIRQKLAPPPPVEENVYDFSNEKLSEMSIESLPGSLIEALGELERDEVLRETLGERLYQSFMRAKKAEWDQYRTQVTPWEIDQYLTLL
ncbi:MAG TPA: type I glutamate--ammonia ligase [Anaerolineae bacterium]|nr:type I glutamate--ammonia ligase [Anaerolineae bacterium]